MASFTQSSTQKTHSFIREITSTSAGIEREIPSQLEGGTRLALDEKIDKFSRESEPLQRLVTRLEAIAEQRHLELREYLDSLEAEARSTNQAEFTLKTISIAWQVWLDLRSQLQQREVCLEVPDACPGNQNNLMYTWSKSEHYLECEIFGNGAVEFFYRNRVTNDVWGEDATLGERFSSEILEKATLFAW